MQMLATEKLLNEAVARLIQNRINSRARSPFSLLIETARDEAVAMVCGALIEDSRTETAQQHEPSTDTKQNETGTIAGTESD